MLTLYDFGNSVCCQKVRISMWAKELTWESVKVDLFKAEQYDPKYLKLNPKGVVPTLVHDGKPIIESTLICEYLDDTFPQPRFIPSDPWQRTRMRLWSKMIDEGLFEGVTELAFQQCSESACATCRRRSAKYVSVTLETRVAGTVSWRRMNSACIRHMSNMGLRPTNGHSSYWKIRSLRPDLGSLA